MDSKAKDTHPAELQSILDSAQRLGVELNEADALQWLASIASWESGGDVSVDTRSGVFGHRVAMLDFSPDDIAYFREVGRVVEFFDEPGVVETALALSGSAAQSKIQTHPGDCDYFERVNILAPSRGEACRILGRVMREKALGTARGATYQLIEVKLGSYAVNLERGEHSVAAGSPIAWTPAEIEAGRIVAMTPAGEEVLITWDEAAQEPGWCKLDWIVADPVRKRLSNASNMLDVTWEAPDGSITPLDGYLDPYFQEVYLEADSIPIFSKLVRHVSSDALDEYVGQLEGEVKKYVTKSINYGKAAKRMYNIFRLTGRYNEAAFIRELFDEPATMLYQVWSLIRTLDDCCKPGSSIPIESLLGEADRLIVAVVEVLEGEQETEIVRQLLRLRDMIGRQTAGQALTDEAEGARQRVINVVNNFFHERLVAVPEIKSYMEGFQH